MFLLSRLSAASAKGAPRRHAVSLGGFAKFSRSCGHARAGGGSSAGFGVQERVLNSTCGAMPRASGHLDHRAGERGLERPPSVGCKLRRKERWEVGILRWKSHVFFTPSTA
jgi:hypothetical protein